MKKGSNAFKKGILRGKICPYCHGKSELIDSANVYNGRSYGLVFACLPCQAWVGVHKGSKIALGRLAQQDLRALKMRGHAIFDPIWRGWIELGDPKDVARNKAYKWLAGLLNIPVEECHFGYFNEERCEKAIYLMEDWLEKYPKFVL